MKRYNTAYYLLSVLLILGSFASMAQNDYGSYILGLVTFGFAFLFLLQFLQSFSREVSDSVVINRLEFWGYFY
ncbi:MAG: hypothetical protein HC811_10825 [Flammeovirgaceae bacterium]|nr:hypothetical protein [Flammeovirgaceae bacterium]